MPKLRAGTGSKAAEKAESIDPQWLEWLNDRERKVEANATKESERRSCGAVAASASGGADDEDEWEFPDDADAEDEEDDEEEERVTGEELAQLQQDAEHIQEVTDARKGSSKEAISEAEDDEDEDEGPRSGRAVAKKELRKLFPHQITAKYMLSPETPVNRMLVAWRTGAARPWRS